MSGEGRLPLLSSRQVTGALKRLGFTVAHTSGSHQTWEKLDEDGVQVAITVVTLGKKVIPRGTLGKVLELAGLTQAEFLQQVK